MRARGVRGRAATPLAAFCTHQIRRVLQEGAEPTEQGKLQMGLSVFIRDDSRLLAVKNGSVQSFRRPLGFPRVGHGKIYTSISTCPESPAAALETSAM
jgi:hypothetical protein